VGGTDSRLPFTATFAVVLPVSIAGAFVEMKLLPLQA
jgi:hypothetical protein